MKMRKLALSIAVVTTTSVSFSHQAFAARSETQQALLESGAVTTGAVAGAAAGGPLGFMIGGVIGMFVADQTRKGNDAEIELEHTERELDALSAELSTLSSAITEQETTIAKLEQKTVDKLALQVLFSTGDDTLSDADINRLEVLAQHLKNNEELIIHLGGHTDPRGTDEYNNVLAAERAKTVEQTLVNLGISDERIISEGFGASFSTATPGAYDQYARDRRVEIEVINRNQQAPIATVETNDEIDTQYN